MLDEFRLRFAAPVQTCVLTHVTDTLEATAQGSSELAIQDEAAGLVRNLGLRPGMRKTEGTACCLPVTRLARRYLISSMRS